MKHFRLALVVFASALGLTRLARAQDEQERQPPTEIPDFSNLDEYVYEAKSTLIVSMRHLSGAKTAFFGTGLLAAPELPTDATTPNIQRTYHDGSVSPDARTAARIDANGNPVIDSVTGAQVFDPIAPDGKTNTWSYTDAKQVTPDGFLAFHTYSASIDDPTIRSQRGNSASGVDVAVARDMGKLFGGRASWSLVAGVSINDLNSERVDNVRATLTTITDLYALDGQVLPDPPYTAPSSTTTPVLDASGNQVLGADGTAQNATNDTTVLINNRPVDRTTQTAVDSTSVSNRWKLKGAYFTFRAGPSISLPIGSRFHASMSAGPAIISSGATYSVTETYQPELGGVMSDTSSTTTYKFLPGYFADLSLQFDLSDHAGFFAGAVFQSAGSYTQTINATGGVSQSDGYGNTANTAGSPLDVSHYSTKVDFANQNGLRAGMTIRF